MKNKLLDWIFKYTHLTSLKDVLVSPLRKVERFTELSAAEVGDLWVTVQKVTKVTRGLNCF